MKRRLIIFGSVVIAVFVSVIVYRELLVRKIGSRIIQDYQSVINEYSEAIRDVDGQWQCPAMTAEDIALFSRRCGEKHCKISACAENGLGGQAIGPRVKSWSGTGGFQSVLSHDTYALGSAYFEDGNRKPSVMLVRKFTKDGHDVKLTLIAWPDDAELANFVGEGDDPRGLGVVDRIFRFDR